MMKKLLVFGASNSKNSINKQFANYTAKQIKNSNIELIDLNDFEMPIFSIDRENTEGIPKKAILFKALIKECEGIIISFAEHNGSYSVAFKNIFDWISRIEKNVWDNKPMLLLATSPGARGGKSVLETAVKRFSFMNQNKIHSFSLPSFNTNFDNKLGVTNNEIKTSYNNELRSFSNSL